MVEKRYRVGHGPPATVSGVIHLHDTASGTVRELALREPGKVGMYVCGPTVYGPPHLGHGRFSLVFDVLRRYLEWTGLEVRYVSNITDIDDNIIERGKREGRPPEEIAVKCEARLVRGDGRDRRQAADRRSARDGLRGRDDRPRRTSSSSGAAPTRRATACTSRSRRSPDYGLLAHQSLEDMRAGGGERALVGEEKR